jgi:hypothetical protein
MILAPLAAVALVVSVATGPVTDPSGRPVLSMQQKNAAMQPAADLGDLIVASMPTCTPQVRAMIDAYDDYFGAGEGEAFFMGPYLDVLPTAVSKWVRDAVR